MKVSFIYKGEIIEETTINQITSMERSIEIGARWKVNGLNYEVANFEISQLDNCTVIHLVDYASNVIDIKSRM